MFIGQPAGLEPREALATSAPGAASSVDSTTKSLAVHNGDDIPSTEANTNPKTDRGTPQGKSTQPMHTAPAHARMESHLRSTTGHWIAVRRFTFNGGKLPAVHVNTPMTPGDYGGAQPQAHKCATTSHLLITKFLRFYIADAIASKHGSYGRGIGRAWLRRLLKGCGSDCCRITGLTSCVRAHLRDWSAMRHYYAINLSTVEPTSMLCWKANDYKL